MATVFCQGCPWRCPYCHNPGLLEFGGGDGPSWSEVTAFLSGRVGLLDGVVFSGGEPTAQPALAAAMAEARALGFKTALHTGGPLPERLAAVLPLTDWAGFDVKAPWDAYDRMTGAAGSGERARASIEILVASGVPFEARTTVHPDLLGSGDLARMADELEAAGVREWVLQPYRAEGTTRVLPPVRFTADDVPHGIAGRFERFSVR